MSIQALDVVVLVHYLLAHHLRRETPSSYRDRRSRLSGRALGVDGRKA